VNRRRMPGVLPEVRRTRTQAEVSAIQGFECVLMLHETPGKEVMMGNCRGLRDGYFGRHSERRETRDRECGSSTWLYPRWPLSQSAKSHSHVRAYVQFSGAPRRIRWLCRDSRLGRSRHCKATRSVHPGPEPDRSLVADCGPCDLIHYGGARRRRDSGLGRVRGGGDAFVR
jgi:hypothetical protein